MKWMSFCCLTDIFWSNSKMTPILYNYNTDYTTKCKHSAEWYDLTKNSTMKTYCLLVKFKIIDSITDLMDEWLRHFTCDLGAVNLSTAVGKNFSFFNSRFLLLAARVSQGKWNQPWHTLSKYLTLDKDSLEKIWLPSRVVYNGSD